MASSRQRQRQLARAKFDRQTARRTARARRQRQIRAGIFALITVAVIVLVALWIGGVFDSDPEQPTPLPTTVPSPAHIPEPTETAGSAPAVPDPAST